MKLAQLLKTTNSRVSMGNTWLYYDNLNKEWVVLEHCYGRHQSSCLYRGGNLEKAIDEIREDK
jgi:hypothetical protein